MNKSLSFALLGGAALLMVIAPTSWAQRPYIGFSYPAGGKQGTTFQVRLGGQGLDNIHEIHVSGAGVTAKIKDYYWRMSPQDTQLLRQQLTELRKDKKPSPAVKTLIERIEYRLANYVQQPHCNSISSLVYVEITIAPDAPPGEREIRAVTTRGPSNPMAFYVGLLPEHTRKPMKTTPRQILGKESLALRERPTEEAEQRITLPCTVNGQIASREVNTYRFTARKGQQIVISKIARQLIPYIADGVPGWFQPVLALYDSAGKEVAYSDDYRFKPDPTILYIIPKDGEYVFAIYDAIYRGREDFVYRITVGELPFISNIYPLGGRLNDSVNLAIRGLNMTVDKYVLNLTGVKPGLYPFTLGSRERQTNRVAFMVDTLPETFEKEPNDAPLQAQFVTSPIIINGRISKPGAWDVFQFRGRANDTIVAEVYARRLDSPLDSILKITDMSGRLVAFNDDCEDLASGLNTHHADSYIMTKLPSDGLYYLYIGDNAQHGGDEYGYRLRISPPQPDFTLRFTPSSIGLRGKDIASVTVFAIRHDGFDGPITIGLKDPPSGVTAQPVTLTAKQSSARLALRGGSSTEKKLVNLHVEGRGKAASREVVRDAVPTEDRMQAFLWRHLVPAQEFAALLTPPNFQVPPRYTAPTKSASSTTTASRKAGSGQQGKFTKGQAAGQLRRLQRIYEDGLFTDEFYLEKVAECETGQ